MDFRRSGAPHGGVSHQPTHVTPDLQVRGSFELARRLEFTNPIGWFLPSYDVSLDGRHVATLSKQFTFFISRYHCHDTSDRLIGKVEKAFLALGYKSTVTDERGHRIGTIQQNLLKSMLRPSASFEILDRHGHAIARTEPQWLSFTGHIDLLDPEGRSLGSFDSRLFSLLEADALRLHEPMDLRLALGFLASEIDVRRGRRTAFGEMGAEVGRVETGIGLLEGLFSFIGSFFE